MRTPAADTVAIVLVGDELLSGHTADRNGSWLGRTLTDAGLRVIGITVSPDNPFAVVRVMQRALEDAAAVVVTGGLGPTSDDVTRPALAGLRAGPQRQLTNRVGTEPGVVLDTDGGMVYAVPGVPAEMRTMVTEQVLPRLLAAAGALPPRATRSLTVVGVRETEVAERLHPLLTTLSEKCTVSYLPRPAEVHVVFRLTGDEAETSAAAAVQAAGELLGDFVAAVDQRIEESLVTALRARGVTVATAESLTGGLLAAGLVSVPGASDVFRGGVVAYARDLKAELAGVPRAVLDRNGTVAAGTAAAMADGVRRRCHSVFGVATTGVAGPDPHDGHPPGTFHVAVSAAAGQRVISYRPTVTRDRDTVRRLAVVHALDLLRRTVHGLGRARGESEQPAAR
ncbi:MAG: nicotinamide-nucleotide amidohydrolase family protein [Jiangellaceae bacterium]|nr:nicotinamide-nucleotide amidohydrolase family protein [Jiangellaceae bacterium]